MKTKTIQNTSNKPIRVVEEKTGRVADPGPLHDFPLKPGASITLDRRPGIRLMKRPEQSHE